MEDDGQLWTSHYFSSLTYPHGGGGGGDPRLPLLALAGREAATAVPEQQRSGGPRTTHAPHRFPARPSGPRAGAEPDRGWAASAKARRWNGCGARGGPETRKAGGAAERRARNDAQAPATPPRQSASVAMATTTWSRRARARAWSSVSWSRLVGGGAGGHSQVS